MKEINEVLRLKRLETSRVETEVTALRMVAPLLSDDEELGDHENRSAAPPVAATEQVQVADAINTSPRPDTPLEWKERGVCWP